MALIFNGFLKSGFKTGRCQSGFQAIGLNTKPETSENQILFSVGIL